MDYTELVKALRLCQFGECGCGKCYYKELKGDWCTEDNHPEFFDCDDKLKLDAAAAIEVLQAEVDEANKSADAYRAMYFAKRGDITIEKVRELDKIDCHFHSALIRLMYKRIEELESEENRQLQKQGEIVRCGECKWYDPLDRKRPFFCPVMDCETGVMEDDFCSRGERRAKMEVRE